MVNRIEKWWAEVKQWKAKFENLFSAAGANGRPFKKEELRMYNKMLSRRLPNMTSDERISRSMVRLERQRLERELYPNAFIRLLRNVGKLTANLTLFPFREIRRTHLAAKENTRLAEAHKRIGFPELDSLMGKKYQAGMDDFKEKLSESPLSGELVNYELSYTRDGNGKLKIEGIDAKLMLAGQREPRMVSAKDTAGLDKEQINELLHGRPINLRENLWKIPDLNDRDSNGNIQVQVVRINEFAIVDEIQKLPLASKEPVSLARLADDLRSGKRVTVELDIDSKRKTVGLEANPLRRSLDLYDGGRKVDLGRMFENGKVKPKMEVVENKFKMKRSVKM